MKNRSVPFLFAAFALLTPEFAGAQARNATIRCSVENNGEDARGTIEVRREDGGIASQGRCDGAISVPRGHYTVKVRLDGAADNATSEHSVDLHTQREFELRARFETGIAEISVVSNGRRAAALVQLEKDGERVASISSGVRAHVSVGRYTAVVRRGSEERRVELDVRRGETTSLEITL